ncbi:MAG: DUF3106 domain-containing protein [Limnohabitans sp.]
MWHLLRLLALLGLSCIMAGLPISATAQASPAGTPKQQVSGNWKQLKPHEKKALAPLAAQWGELTETQRSKWLAIAQHFDQLSPAEQQIMQARMKEWVSLSPVQRNQARLNFNTFQGLSKDEKKSRWDEYQNLSDEQKRQLSAGVLTTSKTAAPSPRPSASDRLVQPALRTLPSAALPTRAPIDKKTLLPVPATEVQAPPASAPVPTREASAS